MAHLGRSLLLALAAGAAGGAAATLMGRNNVQKHTFAKSAVRAGLVAYDRLRQAFGEATEGMSDVLAEVQSELEAQRSGVKERDEGNAHMQETQENVAPFVVKTESERAAHG